MKTLLIIYPHWHPANLAGVHRPRLIGNFIKEFGFKPRILTVKSENFEEVPDHDFEKTFRNDFEVTRVEAFKIRRPRIIGDLGLRAFYQLYKEAVKLVDLEKIDFIWLPIPSFYNALLGRLIYEKKEIPYGIDYIDPWIRDISNQTNLRAKLSQFVAKVLEPIAIKKASLISGVSEPYYLPVIKRNFPALVEEKIGINPHTNRPMTHVAMPYGFDFNDHKVPIENVEYPWKNDENIQKNWVYAGAFLPNSHQLLKAFFKAIHNLRELGKWDNNIRLWFLGTGNYQAKSILEYSEEYRLDDIVTEIRSRFPFLHILNILGKADAVMIIGSTEKHYTASKTFQALLSENPVLSIFHHQSSAVEFMEQCNADDFLVRYRPELDIEMVQKEWERILLKFLQCDRWNPDLKVLDQYSARESARKLAKAINDVIK